MDVQTISTLITSVGFPIVMCIIIFNHLDKERENHKTEVNDLKDVISKINETLAALSQLIEDKLNG